MAQMRPVLKPALVRLWRDESTVQVGLDSERALVLRGIDPPLAALLDQLDGTRELEEALAEAARAGADPAEARRLLELLLAADALDDAGLPHPPQQPLSAAQHAQLLPELRAAGVVHGGRDAGRGVLARRAAARVRVVGGGRLGSEVAAHLRAAGLGQVVSCGAGGSGSEAGGHAGASVVVLTDRAWLDPVLVAELMRQGVPHLVARLTETTGIVGPLVLPGRSSCLRCHHLGRTDRDPAWPRLAAQLAGQPVLAAPTVLTGVVAAHAALQVLALLDPPPGARTAPTAVDGQLEVTAATGRTRRRSWSTHHACGCEWGRSARTDEAA